MTIIMKGMMMMMHTQQRVRAPCRVAAHPRVVPRSRSAVPAVRALFGRFGRGADGHATQQARIHTLNRYGIVTYDFGTRYLQQGCVGDDVAQLQNYLREEGIMRSDDAYPGYFGEVTEAAVIKWQNRHDLPATGAFGDLARETYIQKQELRMQSTLSTSDDLTMLHDADRVTVFNNVGGSLFSGLLLLAAGYAALSQAKAWWERRQRGSDSMTDWQAELTATLGPTTTKAWNGIANMLGVASTKRTASPVGQHAGQRGEYFGGLDAGEPLGGEGVLLDALWNTHDDTATQAPQEEESASSKNLPPPSSSHGKYFRAGGMAQIRKEIEQRKAEEGSATLELPPQPTRSINSSRAVERATRAPPAKPAIAEPGSYFGGAIKRPQFPTIKGRILGRKQDTTPAEQPTNNNTRSNNSTIKEGGSDTVTPAKTAAWDAWSTVNEPGEEGEPVEVAAAEPLASSWMTTEDTGVRPAATTTNVAPLGAPVRDSMTWSTARETAMEPRRNVQTADVTTLVKRLAAKKAAGAQQKGEGEIWVSNTRFTADGAPVQSPSDTTRSPFGAPMESLGGFPRRRATNGSDYKMVTNATPKPPAPMPPRSTTAPLQAAGLGGKGRGDAQGAGQGASQ